MNDRTLSTAIRFTQIAAFFLLLANLTCTNILASTVYDDITISVISPSELMVHGYVEYKVVIINTSVDKFHNVTVFAPFRPYGSGDHIRRLSRSVILGPASSAEISLFQPPVYMNGSNMGVIIDGQTQKKHVSVDMASSSYNHYYYGSPSDYPITILLSRAVSLDDFQNGAEKVAGSSSSKRASRYGPDMWDFSRSQYPVNDWSSNWLSYSRYDGIVVTASEMQSMPPAVSAALLQYAKSGGSLLVLGLWKKPNQWLSPEEPLGPLTISYIHFGTCLVNESSNVRQWDLDTWKKLRSNIWGQTAAELTKQLSISQANSNFSVIENLTIPVRGLLILVLIFTIAIGPVNLYILSKKNKRIWLLWTVPLFSVIASLAVFSYAFLAEGWRGYARIESVTILDQETSMATTIGINAFYCPLTPSGGLHFNYETELTPMALQYWNGGRARTIDWTNDQHLEHGWVAARIPAHFYIRKNQKRRECIKITNGKQGKLNALNGIGSDVKQLWYADQDGKIHTAKNIIAGSKVELEQSNTIVDPYAKIDTWRKLYTSSWANNYNLVTKSPNRYIRPNTYIAILDDSVFIEQALENLKSKKYQSVIFGILEGPLDAD